MAMPQPRILVLSSCTGEKSVHAQHPLTLEDFRDPESLSSRERELSGLARPAGELYTGSQHLKAKEAVRLLRQNQPVDFYIVSAGYGIVGEQQPLVPYEVTFNNFKSAELLAWSRSLRIKQDFERLVASYDLVFVLLGENYLKALELPVATRSDQSFIFLTSSSTARMIDVQGAKAYTVPLTNQDARQYGYGLVGLKGYLLKQVAEMIVEDPSWLTKLWNDPTLFGQLMERLARKTTQIALFDLPTRATSKPKPAKATSKPKLAKAPKDPDSNSSVLKVPNVPLAPNWRLGLQYYIPEWDDQVDPGYDFIAETPTPDRNPHFDDLYAHEIYPTPNYDGVLFSKVKVDESKSKRALIEEIGIHKYIRFDETRPIMGDCGAFGYIKEEEPPYNTAEILEYYQKVGFNLGVSIDHLIVGPWSQGAQRQKRYDITLKNLEEFIAQHRKGGYEFTPIAALQGWDPQSYANMAQAAVELGYDYIGLGGLARATSKAILEILHAVYPHLRANVRMHLFGVARIDSILAFRHMGITSIDSASPLRRAWLGSGANYHSKSGKMYAAIRVPPVDGHALRVKQIVQSGVSDLETLKNLEQNALGALRAYDRGQRSLDDTLEALLAYDELLELPRNGVVNPVDQAKRRQVHSRTYREILQDKPWQACGCTVCQDIGIETILFRGNNRNRRRGFHNTYVFYRRLQELLQNEVPPQEVPAEELSLG